MCCMTGIAQTNVSGFISTNTTWNLAGSPYIVVGNALVLHGYTLTVEPGVVVKFNTDKALQIDGELIAIGIPQSRILFTSNQLNPASGDWASIHFPDTCVDALFDTSGNYLSGSIMKYCDVLYGGALSSGEISIENSSPYFSHCNIMNSSSDGIACSGSACLIDSSSLSYCSGYGVSFVGHFLHSYSLLVQDNSFLNDSTGGIHVGNPLTSGAFYPLEIRRNEFISNTGNGAIYADYNYAIAPIISENYFYDNTSQGGTVYLSAANYIVTCNKFLNNHSGYGGALNIEDYYSTSSYITNNIFEGNISSGSILHITSYHNQGGNTQHTYIVNNLIKNNVVPLGTTCSFFGVPVPSDSGLFYISNNNIQNNQSTNTIGLSGGGNQTNNTFRFAYIKNNNLDNPGVQYELKNDIPYGNPNIYADSNYWGGTSVQHIDSVIYDFFDFANQSVVYYLPILNSPIVVDTSCVPSITTIINNIKPTLFDLTLFPNPTSSYFTITCSNIINKGFIEINNIMGATVYSEKIKTTAANFSKQINLNAPAGIYFVQVSDGERQYTGKVVVE